jgi:ABC-type antimicrobial peptide transport system permease subunit
MMMKSRRLVRIYGIYGGFLFVCLFFGFGFYLSFFVILFYCPLYFSPTKLQLSKFVEINVSQ